MILVKKDIFFWTENTLARIDIRQYSEEFLSFKKAYHLTERHENVSRSLDNKTLMSEKKTSQLVRPCYLKQIRFINNKKIIIINIIIKISIVYQKMVKVNEMINIKIIRQKEDNIRKKTENISNQRDIIYLVKKDN